jgi:transposase-like protein
MATCPNCGRTFDRATLSDVTVRVGETAWHNVSYDCPFCHSSLQVAIAPVSLKTEVVFEVLAEVKRERQKLE